MAIRFRDFYPEVRSQSLFSPEYETLEETVTRANEWLAHERVRVVNVETVVLRNVLSADKTTQVRILTGGGDGYWCQFVRVWYLVENESPNL